jgi:hypothetical protein
MVILKKIKNPFLNDLINHGSYFSNTISSADGTILSWSSIFTGKFPLIIRSSLAPSMVIKIKFNNYVQFCKVFSLIS